MRIATFNVHGFTGYPAEIARSAIGAPGDARNLEHWTDVLRALDCDVVALQEGSPASLVQAMATRLGLYWAHLQSPVRWPGHLLSKYPLGETAPLAPGAHAEQAQSSPYSRSGGVVRIELDAARWLRVYAVHLHPHDRQLREREAIVLADAIDAHGSTGAEIVLGDFNCGPDEAIHRLLVARGFVSAVACAIGRAQPTRQDGGARELAVDHLYLSADLAPALRSAGVVACGRFALATDDPAGTWAHSDHLPVVAEVALADTLSGS